MKPIVIVIDDRRREELYSKCKRLKDMIEKEAKKRND